MFRILHRAGTVLLGLGVILLAEPLGAQEPTEDGARGAGVLVSIGFGVGSPFDAAGHVGLSVVDALPVDLIATLAGNAETNLFGPSDDATSFGVLAGLRLGEGKIWIRPALGVGYVRLTRHGPGSDCSFFGCGEYEDWSDAGVGLAMQGDAVWAPWRRFGVGLTGFGNVNGVENLFGATLTFHVGRLR